MTTANLHMAVYSDPSTFPLSACTLHEKAMTDARGVRILKREAVTGKGNGVL